VANGYVRFMATINEQFLSHSNAECSSKGQNESLRAEVTAFLSEYSETAEGEKGTRGELVRKQTRKQNMRMQEQKAIHAINFHANSMYE
jgi:hypothetical protein